MNKELIIEAEQLRVITFSFLTGLITGFIVGVITYKQFLRSLDLEGVLKPLPVTKYIRTLLASVVLFSFIYLSLTRPETISTGLTLITLTASGIIFGLDTVEGVVTILRGGSNNDNE